MAVKQTRVLQLDRDTLEAMCLAQPEIAIRMIQRLAVRLIAAERRLAALVTNDGEARRLAYCDLRRPNTSTSTRRFSALPSGVLLLAIGIRSPAPTASILLPSAPVAIK